MAKQQSQRSQHVAQKSGEGDPQVFAGKLVEELKKNPKNVKALSLLASFHMQRNEIYAAIPLLQRAIQLSPSSSLLNDLGAAYRKVSRPDLARTVLKKAIDLDGNNSVALYNYGAVLKDLGDLEEALECFLLSGEKDPRMRASAIAASVSIKEGMGKVDEAFADILALIEGGEKTPQVLRTMGNIVQQHAQFNEHLDLAISLIVTAFEEKTISPHEVNSFYYLLGHLYQKKKDYDSAFRSFEKGHEYTNHKYNENYEVTVVDRIIQTWEAVKKSALAVNNPAKQKLFFIVGMPRSGSTLVEQILSVCPDAADLGERNFFSQALAEFFVQVKGDLVLAGARPLLIEEARSVRSLFMQRAFRTRKPTAVVTDKTLSNTSYVGQILQVFPNAKILWTRRDPRDACLSCYTFDFVGDHPYRHDLRTLARYHNRAEKLMKFWQERTPESVYAVDYEEMISNPEKTIRALIAFCDLPWSDDFLRFHQAKRKVNTASYNQVTQPIYTSAQGRWKVYEKHLAPLLEELNLASD